MNTDCAYVIGQSHQVCQDYARAGEGYAILSDGCSSSPDTDIGARLIVCAAEPVMRDKMKCREMRAIPIENSLAKAREWARELGVASTATDATLWTISQQYVAYQEAPEIMIRAWGDGAMAFGGRDGSLRVMSVSYVSNAPFYPVYLLDKERRIAWRKMGKDVRRINWERDNEREPLTLKYDHVTNYPYVDEDDEDEEDYHERADNDEFFSWGVDAGKLRFAAVFSDGVGSFTERAESGETRSIPIGEIVRELVDFKSFKGAFAQRRMNTFLKQCAARDWKHHDDLSIAAIAWMDHEISAVQGHAEAHQR